MLLIKKKDSSSDLKVLGSKVYFYERKNKKMREKYHNDDFEFASNLIDSLKLTLAEEPSDFEIKIDEMYEALSTEEQESLTQYMLQPLNKANENKIHSYSLCCEDYGYFTTDYDIKDWNQEEYIIKPAESLETAREKSYNIMMDMLREIKNGK